MLAIALLLALLLPPIAADKAPRKQTVRVGGRPFSLVQADGSIWVADFVGGQVKRVNPRTNRVVARIRIGGQPSGSPRHPARSGSGTTRART